MTATTMTTATTPSVRPRVKHGVLAVALLAVAGLRAVSGDWLWTAVLGVAGLAELWLAYSARRDEQAAPTDTPATAATPTVEALATSLRGHTQSLRLWTGSLVVCVLGAAGLLLTAPGLAAVIAVLALVCLHRLRRERGSVQALRDITSRHGAASGGVS